LNGSRINKEGALPLIVAQLHVFSHAPFHTNPHAPVGAPPKMKKYSVAPVSPVAARKSVYYEQKRVRSEVAY
jgi:hypothetical protein